MQWQGDVGQESQGPSVDRLPVATGVTSEIIFIAPRPYLGPAHGPPSTVGMSLATLNSLLSMMAL
jgi:hypothetical protein